MITHETYQFICKACDSPYRGLVKKCPHCGAEIRPAKKWTDSEETKMPVSYIYTEIPDDLLIDEIFYNDCFYEPDYDVNGKVIGYSIVPEKS